MLYGCKSRFLTAELVRRLANWHTKRIREMCRVTVLQKHVYCITSESLQKRTGVFSLHCLASRTLLVNSLYGAVLPVAPLGARAP